MLSLATLLGCSHGPTTLPPPPPAQVEVSQPVSKKVTDFEEYTGQIEAVNSVEVRARATGYLDKALFKEGSVVKQGDPLYLIDRRPYQAELDRAAANVLQAKAHLARLELDYRRAAPLLPSKAISQEDFDKIAGDRDEAKAALEMAVATLQTARLNLDFTIVTSPISGRISRQLITPGNLVKADDTLLTTIVSLDPMYAYFDVDERTMLTIRRLITGKEIRSAQDSEVYVLAGLSDEQGFPHTGRLDFIDNQVDKSTGTLRLRGVLKNPQGLLSAGMFARVRVPIGDPHEALLVPEEALGSDQGNKFVYVVGKENQVAYRHVEIGSLNDGFRVIKSGLDRGERVIVSGLQRVRPGVTVDPKNLAAVKPAAEKVATDMPEEKGQLAVVPVAQKVAVTPMLAEKPPARTPLAKPVLPAGQRRAEPAPANVSAKHPAH